MPLVSVNNEPLLERAIFGFDGVNYRVVKVDTDGNIVVAQKANQNVQARSYGFYSNAWQKDPLRLGYSGRGSEEQFKLNATAGFDVLTGSAVPPGEIWLVNAVSANDLNTALASIGLVAKIAGIDVYLANIKPVGAGIPIAWSGQVVLAQGDTLSGAYFGTVLNDDLYLDYAYVRVDIDL